MNFHFALYFVILSPLIFKPNPMKSRNYALLIGSVLICVACAVNPFSGKKTIALVPNSSLLPMSFQQYDQFLEENKGKIITGTAASKRVKQIGKRIAHAADLYLNANGYKDYLKNYRWEFNLVENKTANAWALPGGKVMVYTGILKIANTDAMLAAIMGHEIAHALANHGQQRMSNAQIQNQVGAALSTTSMAQQNQQVFALAYGVVSKFGFMLPFSRKHESEADKIGMTLMAIAGYKPEEAVRLWQRMQAKAGSTPPEFLSTHPSPSTRIQNLKRWIPQAKRTAKKFGVTTFK